MEKRHMNIFAVDKNPRTAAEMLCDKHIVKMLLETGQILSTVHRRYGNDDERLYKTTHQKHPSTLWAGDSIANYDWLYQHFVALNDEYWYRYGKDHLTFKKLNEIVWQCPKGMPMKVFTMPTPAMPDDCKTEGDVVKSYRDYYITKQHKFKMVWTRRQIPDWFRFYDNNDICLIYGGN